MSQRKELSSSLTGDTRKGLDAESRLGSKYLPCRLCTPGVGEAKRTSMEPLGREDMAAQQEKDGTASAWLLCSLDVLSGRTSPPRGESQWGEGTLGVPSPATYFHTSSRPLGLNYDPTLRPAFPSFALLPRGLCPWPESGGRGGTVMPWASGACHSHHPRLCLSPTVQVRQAEAEASREGGSAPSQGGPQVVVLRLAHPSPHHCPPAWPLLCSVLTLSASSPCSSIT